MTTSITVNAHYEPGEVRHRWFPASGTCRAYGTLHIGAHDLNDVCVFLHTPAEIDEVIAELALLKREMDPPVMAGNAPRHTGGDQGICGDTSANLGICNAQDGHDGPDHVAYGEGSVECARWPVAAPDEPALCLYQGTDGRRCARDLHPEGAHLDEMGRPIAAPAPSGCTCGVRGTVHYEDCKHGAQDAAPVADREEMVEFISTSEPGHPVERCQDPGFHDPSVADRSVFCDHAEHHEAATAAAR